MAVRTAYAPVAGEVLTAANLKKLAGGWIGDASVTTNQGSITATVDLTGLSVAVTVGTSRRIKVTAGCGFNSSASANVVLSIQEGATVLGFASVNVAAGGESYASPFVTLTPTSGAHTYKLTMAVTSGTASLLASATRPASIVAEDIGPAS